MNSVLRIRLETTPAQHAKLLELQGAFAAVCNALAPVVQSTGCWNRVALHHLAYKAMRQQFPALGSQMICNALYSVSRASRLVYQHPQSPFNLQRLAGKPLPRLRFLPQSPVYFDRHTLSLKAGQASMYTLDGRMRFNLPLAEPDELRFRTARLREIVLLSSDIGFVLSFSFGNAGDGAEASDSAAAADAAAMASGSSELPQYLVVMHGADALGAEASTAATASAAPVPVPVLVPVAPVAPFPVTSNPGAAQAAL